MRDKSDRSRTSERSEDGYVQQQVQRQRSKQTETVRQAQRHRLTDCQRLEQKQRDRIEKERETNCDRFPATGTERERVLEREGGRDGQKEHLGSCCDPCGSQATEVLFVDFCQSLALKHFPPICG